VVISSFILIKLSTAAGPFRIQWRRKDREHCKTTVTVSSTISRHAVTNRPPIPTIEELDDIIIGDSYRIVTIDNITQNFVQ
jgi:hypothetical protein